MSLPVDVDHHLAQLRRVRQHDLEVRPDRGPFIARFPDIACAGGRVFVSWFVREGPSDRLYVSHARRADGSFAFPQSLGVDDSPSIGRSLAVAGVNDTAYVVFARSDGRLRLQRWLVGAGPDFDVAAAPIQIIGAGSPDDPAADAVIAAAGDKVVVAWFRCGGIFARVSNDRGLTWGTTRRILTHQACSGDFGASPRSIAIRGDRVVVAYGAVGLDDGWMGILSTTNDFAPSDVSDSRITSSYQDDHLVGFLTVAGKARLAAAFDVGDRIRFRREQ